MSAFLFSTMGTVLAGDFTTSHPVMERYKDRLHKQPRSAINGTLSWQPSVTASYHVTDNVRASTANRVSDSYISIAPSVQFETYKNAIYGLQGLVQAEQQLYNRYTAQNQTNLLARVLPFYRLSRDWVLNGVASFQRGHELPSIESTQPLANEPTPFNHTHLQLGLSHLNSRVGQDLSLSAQNYAFQNTDTVTGTRIINDDRNRMDYNASFEVYLKSSGDNRIGWRNEILSKQFERSDFNIASGFYNGVNRDNDGLRSQMTFEWDATRLIHLSGAAGVEHKSFDNAQWSDRTKPVASVTVSHAVTSLTDLKLRGEQSIQTTAFDNAAAFTARTATATLSHELRRNIIIDASGTTGTSDYWDNSREDTIKGVGMAAHYQQNNTIDWHAAYQFQSRDSSFNLADYRENRFTISARIQF